MKSKIYCATDVAEYILSKASSGICKQEISNFKLQKILFYVQAEFLTAYGRPCFADSIEAWDFGPVIPSVFYFYQKYGTLGIESATVEQPYILVGDMEIIDYVLELCKNYSVIELTKMSLKQSVWSHNYMQGKNSEIPNKDIEDFFKGGLGL